MLSPRFFHTTRLIHVYVSSALFFLLIMFSLTGITLNRQWYHAAGAESAALSKPLPAALHPLSHEKSAELVAWITETWHLPAPDSLNFDTEFDEVSLDYQLPAGYAYVTITAGEATVDYKRGSLLGLLNDLHKGRHTGPVWTWVIDLSAGACIAFAITGFVLLLQKRRRRTVTLVCAAIGAATPAFIVWWFVPLMSVT